MAAKTTSHGVKDLVISCIDYRFRPIVAAWIAENLGNAADLVAMAGVSKSVLDGATRDCVLQQIDIATRLHGVVRVHLLDHIDCGAYGGSKMHESEESETHYHSAQCSKAQHVITEKFPTLEVLSYVVSFDNVVACGNERVTV